MAFLYHIENQPRQNPRTGVIWALAFIGVSATKITTTSLEIPPAMDPRNAIFGRIMAADYGEIRSR